MWAETCRACRQHSPFGFKRVKWPVRTWLGSQPRSLPFHSPTVSSEPAQGPYSAVLATGASFGPPEGPQGPLELQIHLAAPGAEVPSCPAVPVWPAPPAAAAVQRSIPAGEHPHSAFALSLPGISERGRDEESGNAVVPGFISCVISTELYTCTLLPKPQEQVS